MAQMGPTFGSANVQSVKMVSRELRCDVTTMWPKIMRRGGVLAPFCFCTRRREAPHRLIQAVERIYELSSYIFPEDLANSSIARLFPIFGEIHPRHLNHSKTEDE